MATTVDKINELYVAIDTRLEQLKMKYSDFKKGFECLQLAVNLFMRLSRDHSAINVKNLMNALLIIDSQTGMPNTGTLERLYLLKEEYRMFPNIHNPIIEGMLKRFVACIDDDDTNRKWIDLMVMNRDQTMMLVQESLKSLQPSLNGGKRHHKKGGKKSHKKGGNKKSHKRSHKKSHKKRSHKRRH